MAKTAERAGGTHACTRLFQDAGVRLKKNSALLQKKISHWNEAETVNFEMKCASSPDGAVTSKLKFELKFGSEADRKAR